MDDRRFSTEELRGATGLSRDDVRRLITWGALVPLPGSRGRGRTRGWDISDIQHAARVAAIGGAGFRLKLSHTLAYLQVLADLYAIYDPLVLSLNAGDRNHWFDPKYPAPVSDDLDIYLHICNGRYVLSGDDAPQPYGLINESRTEFTCFVDFANFKDGRPIWERPDGRALIEPSSLSWRFEAEFNDVEFDQVWSAPTTKFSVNLSLAMRIAVRRVLGLPVAYPAPIVGDAAA